MDKHQEIAIEKIVPNRFQPRTVFNDESLLELAQSIKNNGLLQPIVVRYDDEKKHYEIIAGERRYRAMLMSGFTSVPVIVSNIDDESSATLALIENIQRENLNTIDEAIAYRQLIRIQGITQSELAKRLGKSQSAIANKIRLLDLDPVVQDALKQKQITERHARALVGLEAVKQEDILEKIVKEKLNVKQTEAIVNKPSKPRKQITKGISQDVRIGINTVKHALDLMTKTGIQYDHKTTETEDDVVITIRFKK